MLALLSFLYKKINQKGPSAKLNKECPSNAMSKETSGHKCLPPSVRQADIILILAVLTCM